MKVIYIGQYLSIQFEEENELFIQKWIKSPDLESFKLEMLAYTNLYKKHRPLYTIWLQQLFTLNINDELKEWIEKNVNEPCLSYGNKKCAFVVSKDVLAHISVIDTFEKIKSCITPKHFVSEKKARKWLNNTTTAKISTKKKILYEGVDENGNILLKIPTNDIKNMFKNIQDLTEQELFISNSKHKIEGLTKREKEIIRLVANGHTSKEIAKDLFIEISTVSTHRKNITRKLNIKKSVEWLRIAQNLTD